MSLSEMRTLSPSLSLSQKSPYATPYCKVEVRRRIGSYVRLDWTRLYTGAEPDYYHGLAMPSDGSLVRIRVEPNVDPALRKIWVQRVASPGPASDFSVWSRIDASDHGNDAKLAAYQTSVYAFCIGHDGSNNPRLLRWAVSTNNGATWGAWATILTAAADIGHIAVGNEIAHDTQCLIYSEGTDVKAVMRVDGGAWGSPYTWTNTMATITGLAVAYYGEWRIVAAGTDSAGRKGVWSCTFTYPGGTWSALLELQLAESTAGLDFACPFLHYLLAQSHYRLWYVEKSTTTGSVYQRPYFSFHPSQTFNDNRWREPVPFNLASDYGVAIASDGNYAWSATPSGVWRAPHTPATLDLTARVLQLRQVISPWVSGPRPDLTVELDNSDGAYNAPTYRGCELLVSPGYKTPAGNESSPGPSYWIESWEYLWDKGASKLVIHATDAYNLLARWKARRQYQWVAGDKSVYIILRWILARSAGLNATLLSYSNHLYNHKPAFTIHPGESGLAAARRLLGMVQDQVLFREATARVRNVLASDAVDYAYYHPATPLQHPIYAGRYAEDTWPVNRVQAYGVGLMVESLDWGEIESTYQRLEQVEDLNLTTVALAGERADALLRESELRGESGELLVPVNCGQELWDVVEITDSRPDWSGQKRRVLALELHYSARTPRYTLNIDLGAL